MSLEELASAMKDMVENEDVNFYGYIDVMSPEEETFEKGFENGKHIPLDAEFFKDPYGYLDKMGFGEEEVYIVINQWPTREFDFDKVPGSFISGCYHGKEDKFEPNFNFSLEPIDSPTR